MGTNVSQLPKILRYCDGKHALETCIVKCIKKLEKLST